MTNEGRARAAKEASDAKWAQIGRDRAAAKIRSWQPELERRVAADMARTKDRRALEGAGDLARKGMGALAGAAKNARNAVGRNVEAARQAWDSRKATPKTTTATTAQEPSATTGKAEASPPQRRKPTSEERAEALAWAKKQRDINSQPAYTPPPTKNAPAPAAWDRMKAAVRGVRDSQKSQRKPSVQPSGAIGTTPRPAPAETKVPSAERRKYRSPAREAWWRYRYG